MTDSNKPDQPARQAAVTGAKIAEEIHRVESELQRLKAAETDIRERRNAVEAHIQALRHIQSMQSEPES